MKLLYCASLYLSTSLTWAFEGSLEHPDAFAQRLRYDNGEIDRSCSENSVVAAWCDSQMNMDLDCAILPSFDEYACTCIGNPSLCPTECIGGFAPVVKTLSQIQCNQIPPDTSPNYILKETHALNRCENNAAVSAWCDDFVNRHLECHIFPHSDQYTCTCSGKHSYCPDECVGGTDPVLTAGSTVVCNGIPDDSPNYILKD